MNKKQRVGKWVESSVADTVKYQAYIPKPLPPRPPLDIAPLLPLVEQASLALGRLDTMSQKMPNAALFIYTYVRKEALLSSQIEGTQSTLSDLLLFEADLAPGVPIDDTEEVSSYVFAMIHGLARVQKISLSLRLIREVHKTLMRGARGKDKQPGEFRKSQNWIGGTKPSTAVFVPPPPNHMMKGLENLEKFLNDKKTTMPVLIKVALAHVQFETLHPFLDGNGRLGRLLIPFILCAEGVLQHPTLYLSLYLKTNRDAYYKHLQSVRKTGDWEAWIKFFLKGVVETAEQATQTMQTVSTLFAEDEQKIQQHGKSVASVLEIHRYLQKRAVTTTSGITKSTGLSLPTVLRGLKILKSLDIVKEPEDKPRNRIFVYDQYLSLLNEGTEPLPK